MKSLLIANRSEIALRITQAARELGIAAVNVASQDDVDALHALRADHCETLLGTGPAAYLDGHGIIAAAVSAGCDAIHPGYGFLSEDADFAQSVADAGLTFVGPTPETLQLLGDKVSALALAQRCDVPVTTSLGTQATIKDIGELLRQSPTGVVLKAAMGGGGRGMRVVKEVADLTGAIAAVRAEAKSAFGSDAFYVEAYHAKARHIEVQVIGDGKNVAHLWERDCSVQRLHQKIIEIAPAANLQPETRTAISSAACTMAKEAHLIGLATFEFLVLPNGDFVFMEANPRLQVEHTVTEEITGVDLVQTQLKLAQGASLKDLSLTQDKIAHPVGVAVQLRINCEKLTEEGTVVPTGGTLDSYNPPGGRGLRIDGAGYAGMRTNPAFDSLLAKLIVHHPHDLRGALNRAKHALSQFEISGVATNVPILEHLLEQPGLATGDTTTDWVGDQWHKLLTAQPIVNAQPVSKDAFVAPMQGTILSVDAAENEVLSRGGTLLTMEAMKMQHRIRVPHSSKVLSVKVKPGQTVFAGDTLAELHPIADADETNIKTDKIDPDYIRPDLKELQDRQALTADAARPDAVAKRHSKGKRMARENVEHLCDDGSFLEYGDLTFAAQRKRRSLDDLMRNTPADGFVTGFGTVNASLVSGQTNTAVLAYDYTVLAGTQGVMNHKKTDRMISVIEAQKTPMVIYCEGGGGRPGDVDAMDTAIAGLDVSTFWHFAKLSGLVPMIGIGSGRVFAGNAALLGCCDVVIATRDASIGMGGPAMIEGGGLGVFHPDEVGPVSVQSPNGVIDVVVEDEAEATEIAQKYLSYFQGNTQKWTAPDARNLRHVVPENRVEVYDVHAAIEGLCDEGSTLELRAEFALGMVTAFARIEGRPIGILANNPMHLAGAIDSNGADKATRFVRLCDAFDIPLLTLCDTPGMMVGPEVETTALVRHCSRLFLAAGNATIPMMTVVLRKGYGLGAMAMAGGSFHTPLFTVAWPTGEFGGMGLEGAVRLGYRKELEAVADPEERQALFEQMVAQSYEKGKALNAGACLEIDTVIDPAQTRAWVVSALAAVPPNVPRKGKKHAFVDAW